MFTDAYLQTADELIQSYRGGEPFHLYLNRFFAQHKKFGSRDRKHIAQLCYCWFRAGHALQHLDRKQQFLYALFLCSHSEDKLLQRLDATLFSEVEKNSNEKIRTAEREIDFQPERLFPSAAELSPEIEPDIFCKSLLLQPKLYLRIRPGKEPHVISALQQHHIAFEKPSANCIAMDNSTKADAFLKIDEAVVVQDLNSQKALDLLKEHGVLKKFTAWDCCAASGGKSLLLLDTFSKAHATVSDVREAILHNLRSRFQRASVKSYRWFVRDAASEAPPHGEKFDLIICDAPCTGSGTWSRTPEQQHYFDPQKIDFYAQLQKRITANVSNYLKPGGLLLYITCSVFKRENEDVVAHLSQKLNFFKSAYYKGYDKRADTLFAALFQAS